MSTKNIIIHPIENGEENKGVDLFPLTNKENIVDFKVKAEDIVGPGATQKVLVTKSDRTLDFFYLNQLNGKPLQSIAGGNISFYDSPFDFKEIYHINTTVTNGTYVSDGFIETSGTATVTVTASSGYELPSTVTVTGASSSYNDSTGVITLSNPTGNVSIEVVCTAVQPAPSTLTGLTTGQTIDGIIIDTTVTMVGNKTLAQWVKDTATNSAHTTAYICSNGNDKLKITPDNAGSGVVGIAFGGNEAVQPMYLPEIPEGYETMFPDGAGWYEMNSGSGMVQKITQSTYFYELMTPFTIDEINLTRGGQDASWFNSINGLIFGAHITGGSDLTPFDDGDTVSAIKFDTTVDVASILDTLTYVDYTARPIADQNGDGILFVQNAGEGLYALVAEDTPVWHNITEYAQMLGFIGWNPDLVNDVYECEDTYTNIQLNESSKWNGILAGKVDS